MRTCFLSGLAFLLFTGLSSAQQNNAATQPAAVASPAQSDSNHPQGQVQSKPATTPAGTPTLPDTPVPTPKRDIPPKLQQPKRILGLMPNYRAVSAGAIPPPPTPRQAFVIAAKNSFDYSSFVFVGITSLMAEGSNSHPALGKGPVGYWRYYWRGYVDKTDGNFLVIFALPSMLHEDERYYAKGEGNILGRAAYAASRVLITPIYHGQNTFNASEIFGRGAAQAVSLTYYPSSDRSAGALAEKYGYAVGRDALTNVFREFWPDIDAHFIHRHHRALD